jgi:hypothetical protein
MIVINLVFFWIYISGIIGTIRNIKKIRLYLLKIVDDENKFERFKKKVLPFKFFQWKYGVNEIDKGSFKPLINEYVHWASLWFLSIFVLVMAFIQIVLSLVFQNVYRF